MYELRNFACKTYSSEVERRQNTVLLLPYGLERPQGYFGHALVGKSGVAPAHSGVLPASNLIVATYATSILPRTSPHLQSDANRDGQGDPWGSCTRHLGEHCLQTEADAY
jgi:hypothetical protein